MIVLKIKSMYRNFGVQLSLYFIFFGLLFSSCKTQKTVSSDGFQNEFFGIKGLKCEETKSPDAIDSQVGSLQCEDISFTYDYGKYSNPGPLTPKEEFRRAFDTYHHIKFFENRMIDPKVYKIFLDSVVVINVRRKMDDDKLIFGCEPCNTSAEITFLGDTYLYPLTLSEKQLGREGYSSEFEKKGKLIHKYYRKDDGTTGLYIAPEKNAYRTKNTLSLIVNESTLTQEKIDDLLRNVYLIQTP